MAGDVLPVAMFILKRPALYMDIIIIMIASYMDNDVDNGRIVYALAIYWLYSIYAMAI